jgi:hypothetical protein
MAARIGKYREQKRIDRQPAHAFGVSSSDGSGLTAPPIPPAMTPPSAPTLATALTYSAVTPGARIDAAWSSGLETFDGESYVVQISTDPTFAADAVIFATQPNQQNVSIDGLRVNTTYYVRVRTIVGASGSDWGTSASIATPVDTTPPAAPSSPAGSFQGTGDLVVTWVNPTSLNFRDVELKIYSDSGLTTLYATVYDATQRYVWPAAQNLAATSGAGDPSLYVVLRSRSWGGVFSSTVNTGTVTKTAPTAPTVTVDFTGVDCVFTITPPSDAAYLSFVADTSVTARRIAVAGRYVYPFDQNRLDHSGTPDPVLAYSFTAVDGLNQASTATTGTATNAAPGAPTVTLIGGQNQLVASVTSAPAADFLAYEYVWKKDGSTVLTLESPSAEQQYAAQAGDEGLHSWTCTVRQKDVFAQYSSATASSAVVLDALTIAYLRAGLLFSDSVGNSVSTLAVLKDTNLVSSGVSYAA